MRETPGAAPGPAGEDDPPRTPSVADGIRLIFQAVCRSSRKNAGALPQSPPGRRFLPGPHPLRMRHDFLIKQCSAVAMRTKTRRSRAGRLCRPACAQAHRKKAGDFPKNKLACFSGNPQPFFVAREFSCRHKEFQAHIACFSKCAASPRRVQGRTAGNRLWRMLCLR